MVTAMSMSPLLDRVMLSRSLFFCFSITLERGEGRGLGIHVQFRYVTISPENWEYKTVIWLTIVLDLLSIHENTFRAAWVRPMDGFVGICTRAAADQYLFCFGLVATTHCSAPSNPSPARACVIA